MLGLCYCCSARRFWSLSHLFEHARGAAREGNLMANTVGRLWSTNGGEHRAPANTRMSLEECWQDISLTIPCSRPSRAQPGFLRSWCMVTAPDMAPLLRLSCLIRETRLARRAGTVQRQMDAVENVVPTNALELSARDHPHLRSPAQQTGWDFTGYYSSCNTSCAARSRLGDLSRMRE